MKDDFKAQRLNLLHNDLTRKPLAKRALARNPETKKLPLNNFMNQVGVGSIDKVVSISRFHQLAGWRARLLVPVLTGITEFGKHDSRVT